MKYVIDSSVAFKWVVAEPDADKADRLRQDFRNGVLDLLAPDIFPAEIANALLMAERRGRIAPGQFPLIPGGRHDDLPGPRADAAAARAGGRHRLPHSDQHV